MTKLLTTSDQPNAARHGEASRLSPAVTRAADRDGTGAAHQGDGQDRFETFPKSIRLRAPGDGALRSVGDATLHQVLLNLRQRARRHARRRDPHPGRTKRSRKPTPANTSRPSGPLRRLRVIDTGSGIPPRSLTSSTLLYDQGARQGHRAGPFHRPWHRQEPRRLSERQQ